VISSALVGTEGDVLLEEHGSSGSDNSNGKCDSSILILGDCVTRRNFILHYPFVKYCEFELQMGIKYVLYKFSFKNLGVSYSPKHAIH